MFLRHLRRTRFILHVVDAATGAQDLVTSDCDIGLFQYDMVFTQGCCSVIWSLHRAVPV